MRLCPLLDSEAAEKSVSARPGPILEGTLRSRMGPGRAGINPTSGPGWVRNAGKQSTWRIWTGPPRTRDGTWTGPGPDPGVGLDGTPRDSNRLLGLSDRSLVLWDSCWRSAASQQDTLWSFMSPSMQVLSIFLSFCTNRLELC